MFNHFPSIEGFHHLRKAMLKYRWEEGPMKFRAKVKLHGTNAGIVIRPDGTVMAQSRTRIINTDMDNAGFARWVDSTKYKWVKLSDSYRTVTVFGEWFGEGIQNGVAACQIKGKHFAIFALQLGSSDDEDAVIIVDPYSIKQWFSCHGLVDSGEVIVDNVHILPWYQTVEFSFFDDSIATAVDEMNKAVHDIEECDPWIEETFDVKGTGEGLVYYYMPDPKYLTEISSMPRETFSRFVFKAKGEKHKTVKQREAVQLDPETANSVNEFVDKVLTEARLEQGVREIARGELVFEYKLIGPFIGWISRDVHKETQDELEASGLEWKPVNKRLAHVAREWYIGKMNNLKL